MYQNEHIGSTKGWVRFCYTRPFAEVLESQKMEKRGVHQGLVVAGRRNRLVGQNAV